MSTQGESKTPGKVDAASGRVDHAVPPKVDELPAGLESTPRTPRGSVVDRRMWPDRQNMVVDGKRVELDGSGASGLDRRRGPGRRLSDFTRSAEGGEMTREQFLFLMAIEEFKKANDRAYPTWTDVLEVVRLLGYRKTMRSELSLRRAEDWQEPADSASNVRPARWHERQGRRQEGEARGEAA